MNIQLALTKRCKAVDKYEVINPQGDVIENPPVSALYIDKDKSNGAKFVTIQITFQ